MIKHTQYSKNTNVNFRGKSCQSVILLFIKLTPALTQGLSPCHYGTHAQDLPVVCICVGGFKVSLSAPEMKHAMLSTDATRHEGHKRTFTVYCLLMLNVQSLTRSLLQLIEIINVVFNKMDQHPFYIHEAADMHKVDNS